ncbi:hypothetical protein BpHYR1_019043, partial [Brachionus plicatilis]
MNDFGNNSFSDQIENSVENQVDEQIEIDSNTNDKDLTEDLINRIQNSSFEESFDFTVEEKRLYYGSDLSTKEASLLIILFFNHFDLSSFAQQKLLELIRMLLPISNDLPKTINKLKNLRDSIKNKLVYGIWFGSKKPTSDILFSNLIEEIETINSNGIKFNRNFRAYNFSIKIYGILCDTPAKSMVLNMNQFNGYFGYAYCLNPGDYKNIYKKMTYSQKDYSLRSKETFEFDSQIGTEKLLENGIKGKIAISKKLHLPNSIPIDYMHLVCLGIFKSILNNWFDSSNHKEDFYIGKQSIKKKLESE